MVEDRAAAFLRKLNIKKHPLGGFDRTDTFDNFKELILLYEDIIEEYRAREEETEEARQKLIKQFEDKLRDSENTAFMLRQERGELEQLRSESEQLKSEVEQLRHELELMTSENLSLRASNTRLSSELKQADASHNDALIKQKYDSIKDYSGNLLSKVKEKAEAYLSSAKEESELIRESAIAEKAELLKTANDEILRRRAELASEISTLQNEHRMVLCALQIISEQLGNMLESTEDFSDMNILL